MTELEFITAKENLLQIFRPSQLRSAVCFIGATFSVEKYEQELIGKPHVPLNRIMLENIRELNVQERSALVGIAEYIVNGEHDLNYYIPMPENEG